jgi:hypothetical protein
MTVDRIGTIKNKVVEGPPFRPVRPAK